MNKEKYLAKVTKVAQANNQTLEEFVDHYLDIMPPSQRAVYGGFPEQQAYNFFLAMKRGKAIVPKEDIKTGCFIKVQDPQVGLPTLHPCAVFPTEEVAYIVPVGMNMCLPVDPDDLLDHINTGQIEIIHKKATAINISEVSEGEKFELKEKWGETKFALNEATAYLYKEFSKKGITDKEEIFAEVERLYKEGYPKEKEDTELAHKMIKVAHYHKCKYGASVDNKKGQLKTGDVLVASKTLPFMGKNQVAVAFVLPDTEDIALLIFTPPIANGDVVKFGALGVVTAAAAIVFIPAGMSALGAGAATVAVPVTIEAGGAVIGETTALATAATATTGMSLGQLIASYTGGAIGGTVVKGSMTKRGCNITVLTREELAPLLYNKKLKWVKEKTALKLTDY